jgi:hypothetical protein
MKMKSSGLKLLLLAALMAMIACQAPAPQKEAPPADTSQQVLHAHFYDSGFSLADDNYNACFYASNRKVYYVLASGSVDTGAPMCSFDPATGKIDRVGDLTEAAGEKGMHAVPQGKGHSLFVEYKGKLYFATHIGYYNPASASGVELAGTPPPGYKPYPGGHFLSYDLATGHFENLAKAPEGEGIISFMMDPARGRLYGITWPSGEFLRYDMKTHDLKNFGSFFQGGEKGIPGKTFQAICRSLAVDPDDGSVYFSTAAGDIMHYDYSSDSLQKLQECNLRKDIFGQIDPSKPGTMGYGWRQIIWYPPQKVFYGMHGRTGYLFKFDPRARTVEVVTRLVSDATFKSGVYDRFAYGYLGLELGPDGHTIYYLTGSPLTSTGGASPTSSPAEKVAAGGDDEEIHFVTYDITSGKRIDHGVLQLENGMRPFFAESIAIGSKNIYTVSKIHQGGHLRVDLLSFPNPIQ